MDFFTASILGTRAAACSFAIERQVELCRSSLEVEWVEGVISWSHDRCPFPVPAVFRPVSRRRELPGESPPWAPRSCRSPAPCFRSQLLRWPQADGDSVRRSWCAAPAAVLRGAGQPCDQGVTQPFLKGWIEPEAGRHGEERGSSRWSRRQRDSPSWQPQQRHGVRGVAGLDSRRQPCGDPGMLRCGGQKQPLQHAVASSGVAWLCRAMTPPSPAPAFPSRVPPLRPVCRGWGLLTATPRWRP